MLSNIKYILPPILFSIYPSLYLFSENVLEVKYTDILPIITYSLFFGLAIFYLFFLSTRNLLKSSLLTSIFIIIFYSYGYLYEFLIRFIDIGYKYFLIFMLLVFIIISFCTYRSKRKFENVLAIFNVIGASLVILCILNISYFKVVESRQSDNLGTLKKNQNSNFNSSYDDNESGNIIKRDIYYLIFDQYARADVLNEDFGFDNNEFIGFLNDKGFYIAGNSYSSYPHTRQSLASSLNMQYINELVKDKSNNNNISAMVILDSLLEDFEVMRILKSEGYRYLHFGSDYGATSMNKFADLNYNIYSTISNQSIIVEIIYSKSLLSSVLKIFGLDIGVKELLLKDLRTIKRERVLYQFKELEKVPDNKSPTFVFAHFLIPHGPFVFDSDGDVLSQSEEKKRSYKLNFINQTKFINKKIMKLIESLLSQSEVKPIIIIQSDEGPYPKGYSYRIELHKLLSTDLKTKFGILNAYYLPDAGNNYLYPDISPVNSFRIIFNEYFGKDYKMLKEKYFLTNYQYAHQFIDVSNRLKNN